MSEKDAFDMNERDAFQEKINTELELVQIRFAEFKAQAERLKMDAQKQEHARHVAELEQKVNSARARLRELDEADDDTWEQLKDVAENTWTDLQATLQNTISTFKEKA